MWLKRSTPQNIVIGGAAGALPPIVGYAAATGEIGLASIALFAIIFVWTPPHFWALALVKSEEYGRAGVPMLPNVKGADRTRRDILLYALVLAPLGAGALVHGLCLLGLRHYCKRSGRGDAGVRGTRFLYSDWPAGWPLPDAAFWLFDPLSLFAFRGHCW